MPKSLSQLKVTILDHDLRAPIRALRHSHDGLNDLVRSFSAEELSRPSYARDWTIAQVMSHLGSGAEVFSIFLDAALSGNEPTGPEVFPEIWAVWDAREPEDAVALSLDLDTYLVERLESLDNEQLSGM